MLDELKADLESVAQGIVQQAQVERGSRWIHALQQEHPSAYRLLMALLNNEPREVMTALCLLWPEMRPLKKNEHVLRYIGLLQQELRGNRNGKS